MIHNQGIRTQIGGADQTTDRPTDTANEDVTTRGNVNQATGFSSSGLLIFRSWNNTSFLPMNAMWALYFLLYVDDTVTEPSEGSDQTAEVATDGGESTEGNNSEVTGTFDLG